MSGDVTAFVLACLFFGFGTIILLSLLRWAVARLMHGGRTQGSIVEIQLKPGARGRNIAPHIYYRPLVRYVVGERTYEVAGGYLIQESRTRATVRGNRFTHYETRSMPPRYHVGQTLQVAFDPGNPAHAEVVDPRREMQVVLLQAFFGVLFMLVGLGAFWLNGNLAWLGLAL